MMLAQFVRTNILLGESNLTKLAGKHVVVAGVGGVGGYVVEALVRGGIGKLTLVDNDVVDISNLNRQLIGNLTNLGQSKVSEFAKRVQAINPQLELCALHVYLDSSNVAEILHSRPDYVIDCIDTIEAKLALITYCLEHKLPLVSSMGAGNRIDVTKVKIADIAKTQVCALARNIRLRLRQQGIKRGLTVVYSEETPYAKPLPAATKGARPTNGTISYLPALFGIMLAGKVLRDMIIHD